MTTGGGAGGGVNYGDDYVQARISVDVPEASIAGVREITQETERLRTTLEATARASSDTTRYLAEMAEATQRASAAQAELISRMQMSASMGGRGGPAPFMGVPTGGYTTPFGGEVPGMGVAGGYRPPNPSDVAYQMQQLPQTNPRAYLNMQQARGNMTAADMVSISAESTQDLANKIAQREAAVQAQGSKTDGNEDSKAAPSGTGGGVSTPGEGIQERIARASSLAGQVMNEIGPGGSSLGLGQLAVKGLQWGARRASQAPGRAATGGTGGGVADTSESGLGGSPPGGSPPAEDDGSADDAGDKGSGGFGSILKMLGPVAGVATAALSAFGIIQKGGSMIQGMRNVAAVRGGAAGEGAEVEFKARMLSMNPFITSEQARQVYQAVMSEGYADASGAGADNVIDFMTHNLTSMNISVADSAKMLRSVIVGSGAGDKNSVANSVAQLGKELDTIRTLSREGVMSTPDFRAGVMNTQNALLNAGAPPGEAMASAMTAEQMFSNDQVMKGQYGRIAGSFAQDREGALLRSFGGPGGTPLQGLDPRLLPQVTAEALEEKGGGAFDQAWMNSLGALARQAAMAGGPEENQVYLFQQRLRQQGIDTDATTSRPTAQKLFEEVRSGKAGDELHKAEQDVQAAGGGGSRVGASNTTQVSGTVTIGLTQEAQRLLVVQGGNSVKISPNAQGANKGMAGYQLNTPPPGDG